MFKLTNFIAINVAEVEKTTRFYRDVMGFELVKGNAKETQLVKDNLTIFFDEDLNTPGTVFFEFETLDIEVAVPILIENGCSVRRKFSDKSFLFTDPFGVNFHLYESGAELNSNNLIS